MLRLFVQCDGHSPCGRCHDRSLECCFTTGNWRSKKSLEDEVTVLREEIRKRDRTLKALQESVNCHENEAKMLTASDNSPESVFEETDQAGRSGSNPHLGAVNEKGESSYRSQTAEECSLSSFFISQSTPLPLQEQTSTPFNEGDLHCDCCHPSTNPYLTQPLSQEALAQHPELLQASALQTTASDGQSFSPFTGNIFDGEIDSSICGCPGICYLYSSTLLATYRR